MNFIKFLTPAIIFVLLGTGVVSAEEGLFEDTQHRAREIRDDIQDRNEERREDRKDSLENRREDTKENIEERRDEMQQKIEDRRESVKERVEERREELKDRIDAKKDDLISRIEERKENSKERREKLEGDKKEVVQKHLNNIFERFEAALDRLSGIGDRIQSRINKFNEEGVDTSDSQSLLDSAIGTLSDAEATIAAIGDTLGESLEDEISKETIRDLATEGKDSIKASHAAFVDAIKVLKGTDSPSSEENIEDNETDVGSDDEE